MTRRVLITGAAGSVGREATAAALERGDLVVRALDLPTLRSRRHLRPFRDRAEVLLGDLRSAEDAAAAVEDVDVVIHLAAIIPPKADVEPRYAETVNVGGTRQLMQALGRRGRPIPVIHASSISVYGDRLKDPWIRVDDPLSPSPHDHYAVTKIRGEELVRASGMPWTIFRLSAVFRPETSIDPLMFHMPLGTAIEMVSARDCGYAFVQATDPERFACLEGKVFNLAGGPRCRTTYRELLDEVMPRFGLGRGFFPEEAFAGGNFHCGYYEDSGDLEAHLGFQRESLEAWVDQVGRRVPAIQRRATQAMRPVIRRVLLGLSEPYQARRRRDPALLERYCCEE